MALNIGRMGCLVRPKPKFLDSWESNHLSKAALKRSMNFSIFITTSGTLILAHCVNLSPFLYIGNRYLHVSAIEKEFVQQKFSEAIDQPPMECPFVYTMSCILTAEKYKMGRKKIPVRMQHFLEFLFYCFIFLVSSIVC